jgi:hypothetical protein
MLCYVINVYTCLYHLDQIHLVCVNPVNTNQLQSTPINWWFSPRALLLCNGLSTHGHSNSDRGPCARLHLGWASGDFPRAQ